jgi:hypothetical protein
MQVYPAESLGDEPRKFRLLTLLPGVGDEAIRCTLHIASHDDADVESYEALSYEWGDSAPARAISVDGIDFSVGENLFQALRHLRLRDAERVLWIDAICINQSDVRERNHQVQQMAEIYRRAHQVVSWIGLETDESRAAFGFLRAAFTFSPHNRRSLMDDPGWRAVPNLCARPYWRRVWMVQEICLAQRLFVKCGANQIPWQFISELRTSRKHIWPQYLSPGERVFMRSVLARIDHHREMRKNDGCVLWSLLEDFQDSLCRDVHDRVCGSLEMANDCDGGGRSRIATDYSKSVAELYVDVMCFHQDKFRRQADTEGRRPPHGPQLAKLSEFLQQLFAAPMEHESLEFLFCHWPDAVMDISVPNVMVIEGFLNADNAERV